MSPTAVTAMPVRLFASIGYYSRMAQHHSVVVDTDMPFDKRCKAVHRYEIADAQGVSQLTVPINRPHSGSPTERPLWHQATVSRHGQWWRLHRTALESAYGRTPFFEFIIDKFDTVLCDPAEPQAADNVVELAQRADEIVRSILLIDNKVEWRPLTEADYLATDLRRTDFALADTMPYWQVRQSKHGFLSNLSILDLIFNLGPEAALYIRQ